MSKKTYVPSSEQLEQLLEDDDREQTVEQMIGPEPVDDAEPEEEEWF